LQTEVLGVDIGGVIIDRVNDGTDTSFFGENYLRTTAVPKAFEVIRDLAQKRFGNRVYLVSKCGSKTEAKTLEWLAHHRFYEVACVASDNVRFCRERHEKAGICQKLGITHFVDDRLEVLSYLTSVGKLFLFQPQEKEIRRFAQHLNRVQRVESWQEIRKELLS
jgi:hypothetical protein